MQDILNKAKLIKLLLLDVDGVLTDGRIYFTEHDSEIKAFNTLDGLGIKLLQKAGVDVGVITARQSMVVERRMNELNCSHVYQGQEDKRLSYQMVKDKLDLQDEQIAVMGDDLIDLPLMCQAGLGIAVPNACATTQQHADWITEKQGGFGAVREVCELIMQAQGSWDKILTNLGLEPTT